MHNQMYLLDSDHARYLEEEPAPTGETSVPPAPKNAKQLAAKRNQERVKSILLLAIPDEYLLKFHNFENFTTASNESLDKAYDRVQKLISQLEVHGAPISKEDINQEFLRSLPPSWNQIALIMRNKPDIDEIDIDDLYNNHKVYEDEMKMSSSSTSTSQNLAFLSSENTSSTNEVSTASGDFGVSTAGGISQVSSTLCAHDVMAGGYVDYQSEEIHSEDRKELGFQRKMTYLEGIKGEDLMVTMAGAMHQQMNLHHRHCSSSSSDNEVQKCSKQCLESFKTLQKNYDSEREKHSRARLEIQGYELALESLESRILVHEKNELAWGEKYEFQNYELKCREIKINNLNLELEKVVKERDELKLKIEKWEESSKNLNELLNSQMSARDKTGLGYGTQLNEMSNNSKTDSEISLSVFYVRSSDEENTPANDRFSKADGFHAVPPPITGNFLTLRADISFTGLDEYAIRKKIIESKTTDLNTKTSKTVGKTNEANTQKPKTVYESVNRDKVIIEDWNSDDEDDVSELQTIRVLTRTGLITPVKQNKKRVVHTVSTARPVSTVRPDHAVVDSGCSSHMIGNKAYLSDYEDYNGGFVAFGSDPKG
ncbi:hypothetical protein Tco_0079150, partial [Tanacetum coccineum]